MPVDAWDAMVGAAIAGCYYYYGDVRAVTVCLCQSFVLACVAGVLYSKWFHGWVPIEVYLVALLGALVWHARVVGPPVCAMLVLVVWVALAGRKKAAEDGG